MSTENAGQAETVEQCMERMMKTNQEMTLDQAKAACTNQKSAKSSTEFNLPEAIIKVMQDFGVMITAQLRKQIEDRLHQVVEDTQKEIVTKVKKGLGLENDPVVHLSEIENLVRKIVLDAVPPGKRTDTATPDKPDLGKELLKGGAADGTGSQIKPAAQRFQELAEGKGAA